MVGMLTVPLLTATQSSWLAIFAPVIVTPVLEPISNPSVLAPREFPAVPSIVTPETVRSVQLSILKTCTGGLRI